LLKTYLAYQTRSGQSAVTTYDRALRQYNGEPGDRKVRYAKNVIAAARAIGLDSQTSADQDEQQDLGQNDAQSVRDRTPVYRTPTPTPSRPTPSTSNNDRTTDTDPAAYEIFLMYMDGMQGGRIELQSQVLDMQTRLKKLGYGLSVDGKYGDETAVVIAKFQRANRHIVDGFGVSMKDWNLLQQKTN
jgi:hypothetical protein